MPGLVYVACFGLCFAEEKIFLKEFMIFHDRADQIKKGHNRDFPGGPVVKTSPPNAGVLGSVPGWGAKIPDALWPKNQNIKQKEYCKKFTKTLKMVHVKKKIFKKKKYNNKLRNPCL